MASVADRPSWNEDGRKNFEQKIDTLRPPFLYTLDQIAQILNMSEVALDRRVYKMRPGENTNRDRYVGEQKMVARNVGTGARDDWRITDAEFYRWLKLMGFTPMPVRAYF